MLSAAQSKRMASVLASVQQRAAKGMESVECKAAGSPISMFLPGVTNLYRAMPNHLARSSMFAPAARGRKRMHNDFVLVSRGEVTIRYWGEQLDESQADVWMQAMFIAANFPLGAAVTVNRAEFLRSIGRHTGSEQYEWLHRAMTSLTFAMFAIKVVKNGSTKLEIGTARPLRMIDGFEYDDELKVYRLRIDPRWKNMYDNQEFSRICWRTRLNLENEMAKALQRLIATSSDSTQRYSIDWLKSKLQYRSPVHKFKKALGTAMRELERVEVIVGGRLETSKRGLPQVVWTKL